MSVHRSRVPEQLKRAYYETDVSWEKLFDLTVKAVREFDEETATWMREHKAQVSQPFREAAKELTRYFHSRGGSPETGSQVATPTKLRSGKWGARVKGRARAGDIITIRAKSGKTWKAKVTRVVWSGQGVTLVATEGLDRGSGRRSGRATSHRKEGRRTGCYCGSREYETGELIWSPNNCAQCNYDEWG